MQIRAADPAEGDLHDHIAGAIAELGNGEVFDRHSPFAPIHSHVHG
jgi:hypothetical protein